MLGALGGNISFPFVFDIFDWVLYYKGFGLLSTKFEIEYCRLITLIISTLYITIYNIVLSFLPMSSSYSRFKPIWSVREISVIVFPRRKKTSINWENINFIIKGW